MFAVWAAEQATHFLGHDREHARRLAGGRHERRHPSQRCLLVEQRLNDRVVRRSLHRNANPPTPAHTLVSRGDEVPCPVARTRAARRDRHARARRRSVSGRRRPRGPPRAGPRQRRLRRPALRPRPALRDQRAHAAARRHGDDPRARDAVALALQPRLRRPERRLGVGRRPQREVAARGRGAGDHAASAGCAKASASSSASSHFVAVPTEPRRGFRATAFFFHLDGSATGGQPFYEHLVYPSNDHPRDKASFTFRFDVPAGTTAVANGVPLGRWTRKGADDLAVRAAPADGHGADPAGGRQL